MRQKHLARCLLISLYIQISSLTKKSKDNKSDRLVFSPGCVFVSERKRVWMIECIHASVCGEECTDCWMTFRHKDSLLVLPSLWGPITDKTVNADNMMCYATAKSNLKIYLSNQKQALHYGSCNVFLSSLKPAKRQNRFFYTFRFTLSIWSPARYLKTCPQMLQWVQLTNCHSHRTHSLTQMRQLTIKTSAVLYSHLFKMHPMSCQNLFHQKNRAFRQCLTWMLAFTMARHAITYHHVPPHISAFCTATTWNWNELDWDYTSWIYTKQTRYYIVCKTAHQ